MDSNLGNCCTNSASARLPNGMPGTGIRFNPIWTCRSYGTSLGSRALIHPGSVSIDSAHPNGRWSAMSGALDVLGANETISDAACHRSNARPGAAPRAHYAFDTEHHWCK
jgi:hypothetical protein